IVVTSAALLALDSISRRIVVRQSRYDIGVSSTCKASPERCAHELAIRENSDARQIETVRVPAAADRRIVAGQPVRMPPTGIAQQLQLFLMDREQIAVEPLHQCSSPRDVLRVERLVLPFDIVQNPE